MSETGPVPPDLCEDCNVGEHGICDFVLRREAARCGCTSSRHANSGLVDAMWPAGAISEPSA